MDDSPIQTALCVIGHPIGGNPTQFVALRALAALGLDWQFMSFDVDPSRVDSAIAGIDSLGFCGAMIAAPYQMRVAEILAQVRGGVDADRREAAWHDCLHRDAAGQLRACNVLAEAMQSLISTHAQSSSLRLERCLWVGEESHRASQMQPFLPILPETKWLIAGTNVVAWPVAATSGSLEQAVTELPTAEQASPESGAIAASPVTEVAADRTPADDLESAPALVLWDIETRPTKKAVAKAAPHAPSPVLIAELLTRLHPGSLLIDLAGTFDAWNAVRIEAGEPSLAVISQMELEVMRLGLALQHWTGSTPNLDLMREAIEEYLVI